MWEHDSFFVVDMFISFLYTITQMLVIDNDNYYLTIGKDAASTIECIDINDQVAEWIRDIESHTDEECRSTFSYSTTNEEMLNYVYGNTRPYKNEIRQVLSEPVLIFRTNIDKTNGTKTLPSVAEEDSYILEELLHATFCQNDEGFPDIKRSNSIPDNFNTSTSNYSMLSQKEMGQYVDYHAAVTDTVTSDSGQDSGSTQTDFTSTILELPTESDSVFTYSMPDESYNDHNMSISHDRACKSVPHLQSDLSYHSSDDSASHDPSSTQGLCTTPTTGVYQSINIAGGYDDATL